MTNSPQTKIVKQGRDKALDFVKGCLVVGMVVYHTACLNDRADDPDYMLIQYLLHFVSGSWIFISGAIISSYYSRKSIDNWSQVAIRLISRGMKLLFIFLIINVLLIQLGWARSNLEISWNSLYTVFVPGTGLASFEILVSIGYVLLVSPFLLINSRLGAFLALVVVLSAVFSYSYTSRLEYNFWAIACGMGGFLAGKILSTDWFSDFYQARMGNPINLILLLLLVALYYFLNIYWGYGKQDILVYLLGIMSILAVLYLSYRWVSAFSYVARELDMLGNYPLFSYIWQMGVIVFLETTKSRLGVELPYVVDLFIVMLVLLCSVWFLRFIIARNIVAKEVYRWCFS